ncbi:olfactory receptor 52K2-like [Dendropsophus ebraccatus]|uniref:olfactory receptor 52K2-like n=1 Tax=Dendropsophus ebraccatus TaxID=150705 RepID=UPI0038321A02
MAAINISSVYTSVFILVGIPDLESYHVWLSVPIFIMYVVAMLGNLLMFLLITMEPRLHNPMYYFLCTLSITDLIVLNAIVLKLLCILWLNDKKISFFSCLVQMFLIYCFSSSESGILTAMAFDRYMAICDPLHYTSALTNTLIVKIVIALVIRGAIITTPIIWMANKLPYCQSHHIPYSYCDHMSVVKLACTDVTINSVYGLITAMIIIVFDVSCIAGSYICILRAVLRLSTKNAKSKAFGTCTSHISIILIFYSLGLFSILTHRLGHVAPYIHVIVATLYLLIPPTLNPIIYGVKTKEIRTAALQLFTRPVL